MAVSVPPVVPLPLAGCSVRPLPLEEGVWLAVLPALFLSDVVAPSQLWRPRRQAVVIGVADVSWVVPPVVGCPVRLPPGEVVPWGEVHVRRFGVASCRSSLPNPVRGKVRLLPAWWPVAWPLSWC